MSLVILFHFLCAQYVSDTNISIIRSLRLCCWITTSVVLFSVRCVLDIWLVLSGARFAGFGAAGFEWCSFNRLWCGWCWVVLVLQALVRLVLSGARFAGFGAAGFEWCSFCRLWCSWFWVVLLLQALVRLVLSAARFAGFGAAGFVWCSFCRLWCGWFWVVLISQAKAQLCLY